MGSGVVSKQRNKMEMDRLLSKWSALAKENEQYSESSKFRALRNVFKELSLRDNLDESARKHMLEVNLRGNHKELQKNRLDDRDLELLVQALEELNTSTSVVLDLQFNRISDAGMESLSKYLEVNCCLCKCEMVCVSTACFMHTCVIVGITIISNFACSQGAPLSSCTLHYKLLHVTICTKRIPLQNGCSNGQMSPYLCTICVFCLDRYKVYAQAGEFLNALMCPFSLICPNCGLSAN